MMTTTTTTMKILTERTSNHYSCYRGCCHCSCCFLCFCYYYLLIWHYMATATTTISRFKWNLRCSEQKAKKGNHGKSNVCAKAIFTALHPIEIVDVWRRRVFTCSRSSMFANRTHVPNHILKGKRALNTKLHKLSSKPPKNTPSLLV